MYNYTATVTISAEQRDDVEAVENAGVALALETLSDSTKKVSFKGALAAPENPTHICITLESGLTYYGEIVNGQAEPEQGWIAFVSDMPTPDELGL